MLVFQITTAQGPRIVDVTWNGENYTITSDISDPANPFTKVARGGVDILLWKHPERVAETSLVEMLRLVKLADEFGV